MESALVTAALLLVGSALGVCIPANAQTYPARPITFIVPFPAGTTTDNVARKLAEFVQAKTKVSVIVQNRVGADGIVGTADLVRSPADGYSVLITGNSVHGADANLYKKLPFDPINDFDMIGGVMSIPMVLTVRSEFPTNNLREFVAEAKNRPNHMLYATGNNSTRGASELFKARLGLPVDPVPYRGSPQVLSGLIGGQIEFAFIDANTVGPFLKEGKLKGLAVTSLKPLPNLPNLPPVAQILPGFEFGAWVGVAVRHKTPPEAEAKLTQLVKEFTEDPATVKYLTSISSTPMQMDPLQLKTFVEAETKRWAEIVKEAKIEKQ